MAPPGIDKESNPLFFVERLLEEERLSLLHFGDVRFWKHIEYIDTAQVYRTKSLEYKNIKLMFCECIFFVFFLLALTQFIFDMRSPHVYEARRQQLDYWGGCTRGEDGERGGGGCEFHTVRDIASMFRWMREDFVPKAFIYEDLYPPIVSSVSIFRLQQGTMAWTPRYAGDTRTAVLIGSIRIRQLRVQYGTDKACVIQTELAHIHPECFPPYFDGMQSKMSWAPTWTPDHLLSHYEWFEANFTEQSETVGQQGTYPGDGFYLDLALNKTGAQTRLLELEAWSWLDFRTRAVIVELTTLMPNVNVFVHNKLLFEFPASGGAVVRHDAFAFRTLNLSLTLLMGDNPFVFVQMVFLFALHFLYILYVSYIFYKNGLRFFTYFWSIVDVIIICIFFTGVVTTLVIYSKAASIPNLSPEVFGDPEMFFPIGHLINDMNLSTSLMAMHGLLVCVRVLKYFTLVGRFQNMVRVIERCIVNLVLFGILLCVVLFGFAVAFHLGYGGEGDIFSTLLGAFVATLVGPAGGVDFSPIFARGDMMGPLLFFAYIVIIFLLILKVFLAICIDTYTVTNYEMNEVKRVTKVSSTTVFLWTYLNALRGVKLVGKETEEEKGSKDEQIIPLTSLPEVVANRFLDTKSEMHMIVRAAHDEEERAEAEQRRARGLPDPEPKKTDLQSEAIGRPFMNAIEDQPGNMGTTEGFSPSPPPTMQQFPSPPEEDPSFMMVHRVQLQRMLDDDPLLRDFCGTGRAIEVMRRFRVDASGGDPYETVAKLQATVAQKLQEIEEQGVKLKFDEMETLRTVSQELHSALTESQREWRAELLSVLQMASLLSRALIDLTRRLEQVQSNHTKLGNQAGSAD